MAGRWSIDPSTIDGAAMSWTGIHGLAPAASVRACRST